MKSEKQALDLAIQVNGDLMGNFRGAEVMKTWLEYFLEERKN